MVQSLDLTLDSLTWIIRIIFPCPPEKSMRLPRRCIIHVAVSDGSKINRPDRTLSNRAFTVLSPSISLGPSSSSAPLFPLPALPLFLLPLRYVIPVSWKKSISYTHRRAFKWFRISLDRCFWPVLANTIEQFQRIARRQRRRRVPSISLALLLRQYSARYSNSLDMFSCIMGIDETHARPNWPILPFPPPLPPLSSSFQHYYLNEALTFLYLKKINCRARI